MVLHKSSDLWQNREKQINISRMYSAPASVVNNNFIHWTVIGIGVEYLDFEGSRPSPGLVFLYVEIIFLIIVLSMAGRTNKTVGVRVDFCLNTKCIHVAISSQCFRAPAHSRASLLRRGIVIDTAMEVDRVIYSHVC